MKIEQAERESGPQSANTERRQRVVDEIKRWIIEGAVQPGSRMVEADLTRMLEVSRPTVREALSQLARDGYLVQEAYRGYRVGTVDPQKMLDAARVRVVLDMEAIREIINGGMGQGKRALEGLLESYRMGFSADDPVAQHEAHMSFHRGLWELSGNAFLVKLWPSVEAEMTLSLAFDQRQRHDPERAVRLHERLIEVILVGGEGEILRELEEHSVGSVHELLDIMGANRAATVLPEAVQ